MRFLLSQGMDQVLIVEREEKEPVCPMPSPPPSEVVIDASAPEDDPVKKKPGRPKKAS